MSADLPFFAGEPLDYIERAACRGMGQRDKKLFSDPKRFFDAYIICRSCRARRDCLGYALAFGEYGTWGGVSEQHRKQEWQGQSVAEMIQQEDALADEREAEEKADLLLTDCA